MKKLLLFSLLFILIKCEKLTEEENDKLQSICGTKTGLLSENRRKVLNGVPINGTNQAPWVVSVIVRSYDDRLIQCSGSLISQRHVLTARHCFLAPDEKNKTIWRWKVTNSIWNHVDNCEGDDLILPTEMNARIYNSLNETCSIHGCYDYYNRSNKSKLVKPRKVILPGMCASDLSKKWPEQKDFAIVELEKNSIFSDSIYPVCVPKPEFEVKTGNKIWFAGYGLDENVKLNKLGVLKYLSWTKIFHCSGIDDAWFCTRYSNEQLGCGGDSGAGAIQTVNGMTTIIGIMVRATNCSNQENGWNIYVNLTKHIGDICKYTGVCNQGNIKGIFNQGIIKGISVFGIFLISIMVMFY